MNVEIVPGTIDAAALNLLAWELQHGVSSPAAMLERSQIFHVLIEGQHVLTYGVEIDQGEKTVAWVTLAVGSLPGFDLTAGILPLIEKQLAGADVIAVRTMRPGLVKKLAKQGYATSYTLTKDLKK